MWSAWVLGGCKRRTMPAAAAAAATVEETEMSGREAADINLLCNEVEPVHLKEDLK